MVNPRGHQRPTSTFNRRELEAWMYACDPVGERPVCQAASVPWKAAIPARPASRPVALVAVDRSHRAVLGHLGQLYRHDLSEAYGHLPNDDGTFNDRQMDRFLGGVDPQHRAGNFEWVPNCGAINAARSTARISSCSLAYCLSSHQIVIDGRASVDSLHAFLTSSPH